MANSYMMPTTAEADYAPMVGSAPSAPSYGFGESPAIAREVATVQSQIIIAKKFPRDEQVSVRKIEQACSREKLANNAIYSYAKGGTDVTGASVHLMRAVATAWGNIKYGFEETESDDSASTVRAYAYDMEANTQAERIFKVPHVRHTRQGDYPITDPREVYELIANQSARRERACLAEVLPSDIVEYAMELCDRTRKAKVVITPESLDNLCAAFAKFGVSKAQIEAYIQRNLSAITTTQYLKLKEIFLALRDGMGSPSQYFKSEAEINAEKAQKEEKAEATPSEPTKAPQAVSEPSEEKVEKAEGSGEDLSFNF